MIQNNALSILYYRGEMRRWADLRIIKQFFSHSQEFKCQTMMNTTKLVNKSKNANPILQIGREFQNRFLTTVIYLPSTNLVVQK